MSKKVEVPVEIVASRIAGRGLRATRVIKNGEVIMRMSGKRVSDATVTRLITQKKLNYDNPLQIEKDTYVILDPLPVAGNHSCNPNAAVVKTQTLIAIRNIKKGEEVTYDYSCVVGMVNEGWWMRCRCGTKACRKKIGAWTTLPPRTLARYKRLGALPTFVRKELL